MNLKRPKKLALTRNTLLNLNELSMVVGGRPPIESATCTRRYGSFCPCTITCGTL